jgi:hypothetical protein
VFTAHVRAPATHPAPADVPAARMAVYASLVYRNLDSLLGSCFPVLHTVLSAVQWESLVRSFLAHHRAQTPLFSRIPREFLRYLAATALTPDLPEFVRELAHYEWLELEVSYDPRELADTALDATADPYRHVPILNPLARPMVYAYPVHRIGPDYRPVTAPPEPTYLVVFRERDDGVAFTQLTPVTARLVELMQNNGKERSGEDLLRQLCAEIRHPQPEVMLRHGQDILADLLQRQLLLGAQLGSSPG